MPAGLRFGLIRNGKLKGAGQAEGGHRRVHNVAAAAKSAAKAVASSVWVEGVRTGAMEIRDEFCELYRLRKRLH